MERTLTDAETKALLRLAAAALDWRNDTIFRVDPKTQALQAAVDALPKRLREAVRDREGGEG